MGAEFLPNTPVAGKTTIRFEWAADTAKLQAIAERIAESYHRRGYGPADGGGEQIPFGDLTNQQKLDIIYNFTTDQLKSASQGHARQVNIEAIMVDPTDHEFD